jgi:hypothetical protein
MLRANLLEWVTYAKRANEERIETVHSSWSAGPNIQSMPSSSELAGRESDQERLGR